jgi:hypothetical protein
MSEVRTAFQIWWVLFTNGYVPVGGPLFPESQLRRFLLAITPVGLPMLVYLALSLQINAVLAVGLAVAGALMGWSPAGGGSPAATVLVLLAAVNFLAVILQPVEEVQMEIGERIVPVRVIPSFIPRIRPR